MSRYVVGLFPDRETADHALQSLEEAGFAPERQNAEQFEDPEYYRDGQPQGQTAVVVDPGTREPDVRSIMMRCGAASLQGHGGSGMPTGMSGLIDREEPVPVRGGERATS